MISISISETDHCRQLESLLHSLLPTAPAAYRRKLVSGGQTRVNGSPAAADTLLRCGDTVTIKESTRTRELLSTSRPRLEILYEDDQIIVASKQSGLPVHKTGEDEPTLLAAAEQFLHERGTPCRLRPVNRLDRGTSGAIILGKSSRAAGMFGRVVKETGLGKVYLAIVRGEVPTEGTIDAPLAGKESVTRFSCLFQAKSGAFLALVPVTGRTHQIRRHLQLIGHPILGDVRYGGAALPTHPGLLLHSFFMKFPHPEQKRELSITAPLPGEFLNVLHDLAGSAAGEVLNLLPALTPADISR